MSKSSRQTVVFPAAFSKKVEASFCDEALSSDGGGLLLAQLDRKLKLTEQLCDQLTDRRQAGKVEHDLLELLRTRVFSLALGYADTNDAARLQSDPVLKLACSELSPTDPDAKLAGQSSLCRFENSVSRRDLVQLSWSLAEQVLRIQKKRRRGKHKPKRLTIEIDPTCLPTHGGQQQTFFNGFYDTHCYLPMMVTVRFDEEPKQYMVGAVLRPGNAGGPAGAIAIVWRLLGLIREIFGMKLPLRLIADGGLQSPEIFDFLEAEDLEYIIGIGTNSVLKRYSAELLRQAQVAFDAVERTETFYGSSPYKAGKWKRERRAVYKAEVVSYPDRDPRDNVRYVITNMPQPSETIFDFYYARCDMENRIKELKCALHLQRTSCHRFEANQFRVLLSCIGFALFQILQDHMPKGEMENAQAWIIRERLFKIAVRVRQSVRRIVFELSAHHPWQADWRSLALAIGAIPK
jgi:hypothetical protein